MRRHVRAARLSDLARCRVGGAVDGGDLELALQRRGGLAPRRREVLAVAAPALACRQLPSAPETALVCRYILCAHTVPLLEQNSNACQHPSIDTVNGAQGAR